jgi:chromosome segregation ATPase
LENQPARFAQELSELRTKVDGDLLKLEIRLETELIDLEIDVLADAQSRRQCARNAAGGSERTALLAEIRAENEAVSQDLDSLVQAQRINCQAATQAVGILERRLNNAKVAEKNGRQRITDLRAEVNALEAELSVKSPEWKQIAQRSADYRSTSDELDSVNKELQLLNAECEGAVEFLKSFPEVPLLGSLATLLRIQNKAEHFDIQQIEREELPTFCDFCSLVFAGFATIPPEKQQCSRMNCTRWN